MGTGGWSEYKRIFGIVWSLRGTEEGQDPMEERLLGVFLALAVLAVLVLVGPAVPGMEHDIASIVHSI